MTGASTTPITINGSLTGELENGYVYASQLPRSSTGTLAVNGAGEPASQAVLYSTVTYPTSGSNVQQFPAIAVTTSGGTLSVRRNLDQVAGREYTVIFQPRNRDKPFFGANVSVAPFTETATDYTISLSNLVLTSSVGNVADQATVNTTLNVGKPSGSITISGDSDFTPVYNSIGATSQTLIYDFRSNIPAGISTIPSVQVQVKGGVVQSLLITSNTGKTYTCGTEANNRFQVLYSGGFNLSADGRTLMFTNFRAGLNLNASAVVTLNRTLTSTGQ